MAKIKRISINALENVMKETRKEATVVQWNGLEVVIKYRLSLPDILSFVSSVVDSCFAEDTNTYLPEIEEFAIRSNVLDTYANFSFPKDARLMYELVYNTDAYEFVVERIDKEQLNDIRESIDKKIKQKLKENVEAVRMEVDSAVSDLIDLQRSIESVLETINSEDILTISRAIENGEITEDGIVRAYINSQSEDGDYIVDECGQSGS